jgi:hypothetical protein
MPGFAMFYWTRLWAALVSLMKGASLVLTLVSGAAFFVVLFNRTIADALSNWHGFPGWYAVIIPALLVLYALAHGHYERETAREARLTALEEAMGRLSSSAPRATVEGSGYAVAGQGNVTTGNLNLSGQAQPLPSQVLIDETLGRRCAELAERLNTWADSFNPQERIPDRMEREYANDFVGEAVFLANELVARGLVGQQFPLLVRRVVNLQQTREITATLSGCAELLSSGGES